MDSPTPPALADVAKDMHRVIRAIRLLANLAQSADEDLLLRDIALPLALIGERAQRLTDQLVAGHTA